MLAGTMNKVVRIALIVVVCIAFVHIDVVSVAAIVRIGSPRPIVVALENIPINSFRLNHDNLLSLSISIF